MEHPEYIERERVLETCPDINCRRSGQCRAAVSDIPCARTHEDMDTARYRLATKLGRWARLNAGSPDALDPADPEFQYKLDCRLGELKRLLEQADRDYGVKPAG